MSVTIGKNAVASLKPGDKKNIVVITIDPSKALGPSASGKTEMIAQITTPLGGTKATLGGNIYTKTGVKAVISKEESTEVGKNVSWSMDGEKLYIELDLENAKDEKDVSASGKTVLLASSRGNKPLGKSNITLGLNCYIKVGEEFKEEALNKWLSADGSTTVGPFDFDKAGDYFTFTASLKEGEVTTKQFTPIDGPENKINLTLAKEGTETLESTDGEFIAIPDAFNAEMKVDKEKEIVSIRMRKDGDDGITSSGKSVLMSSNKKTKTFKGVKIALNAIKPCVFNKDDVKKEIIAYLVEHKYDLQTIKIKELRTVVAEKVNPPQDPTNEKFKELVNGMVKEAIDAHTSETGGEEVSASQLNKRGREDDTEDCKEA